MSTHHAKTIDAAKGKWRGILMSLGIPGERLVDRHGPCPLCGGNDRFRFDNQEGTGSYICGQCGAGRGIDLAMKFTGKDFPTVAREIDTLIGNNRYEPDAVKPVMSEDECMAALKRVAGMSVKLTPETPAHRYFVERGIDEKVYPKSLRFVPSLKDGEGGTRPCIIATVQSVEGENVTLHRTFLRGDCMAKADMKKPRKMMPGSIPDGAAIRLSEYNYGALGIAEGIETAMAASRMYDMPVWAAINATMLEKWIPPEGCDDVAIFGDNDEKFGGHAAAYKLAHRLAVKGIAVTVHIPKTTGEDWNDVLCAGFDSNLQPRSAA